MDPEAYLPHRLQCGPRGFGGDCDASVIQRAFQHPVDQKCQGRHENVGTYRRSTGCQMDACRSDLFKA